MIVNYEFTSKIFNFFASFCLTSLPYCVLHYAQLKQRAHKVAIRSGVYNNVETI
jgi:hypothetical protein